MAQNETLVCSVLFLDIADYSKRSVTDQIRLKQLFNAALSQALVQVSTRDRIIVDTGDGAAITFPGGPESALLVALAMLDHAEELPMRMGINLGPVHRLSDLNGNENVIGDGINVAQRIMSFAEPGQLLVSRAYYEVVTRMSREYEKLFTKGGRARTSTCASTRFMPFPMLSLRAGVWRSCKRASIRPSRRTRRQMRPRPRMSSTPGRIWWYPARAGRTSNRP